MGTGSSSIDSSLAQIGSGVFSQLGNTQSEDVSTESFSLLEKGLNGSCTITGDPDVLGIAQSGTDAFTLKITGSELSVTGDAELIQVTSMEVEEFSGEVTAIIIDGSVDCGGLCGGGGTVDGNAELVAAGEIEFTDVNMDAINLNIENEDGEWNALIGNDEPKYNELRLRLGKGAADLGAFEAAYGSDTAIGKYANASGEFSGSTAVGAFESFRFGSVLRSVSFCWKY